MTFRRRGFATPSLCTSVRRPCLLLFVWCASRLNDTPDLCTQVVMLWHDSFIRVTWLTYVRHSLSVPAIYPQSSWHFFGLPPPIWMSHATRMNEPSSSCSSILNSSESKKERTEEKLERAMSPKRPILIWLQHTATHCNTLQQERCLQSAVFLDQWTMSHFQTIHFTRMNQSDQFYNRDPAAFPYHIFCTFLSPTCFTREVPVLRDWKGQWMIGAPPPLFFPMQKSHVSSGLVWKWTCVLLVYRFTHFSLRTLQDHHRHKLQRPPLAQSWDSSSYIVIIHTHQGGGDSGAISCGKWIDKCVWHVAVFWRLYTILHVGCHFFILNSQTLILVYRSLLPFFIKKGTHEVAIVDSDWVTLHMQEPKALLSIWRSRSWECSLFDMGWLRWVGSLKWKVSLAKEPYKRDDILQKRPIILRSLLIVATPYSTWYSWQKAWLGIWFDMAHILTWNLFSHVFDVAHILENIWTKSYVLTSLWSKIHSKAWMWCAITSTMTSTLSRHSATPFHVHGTCRSRTIPARHRLLCVVIVCVCVCMCVHVVFVMRVVGCRF